MGRAEHWLTTAAAGLIFVLPALSAASIYLPAGLWMPSRLVIAAFLGCVVALRLLDRSGGWGVTTWVAAVATPFVGFGALAWLRFPDHVLGAHAALIALAAALVVAASLVGGRLAIVKAALWGWMFSLAATGVVGVWEVATGGYLPGNVPAVYFSPSYPDYDLIASTFNNPNLYAYHIAFGLLLLPFLWPTVRSPWRWLLVPFGLAQAFLLFKTGSRMAILSVAIAALIWLLATRATRWYTAAATAIFVVLMLVKAPFLEPILGYVDPHRIAMPGTSEWVRYELLQSAWWVWRTSGYLGVGPGGFEHWALVPENPHQFEGLNNAHSGLAEVLAEFGLVAVVALLVGVAAAAVATWQGGRASSTTRGWGKAMVLVAITFIPLTSTHSTWLTQPMMGLHLAWIVLLAGAAQATRNSASHHQNETPNSLSR